MTDEVRQAGEPFVLLPKRTPLELAEALRRRADLLCGEPWETPATAAMMREAAILLSTLSAPPITGEARQALLARIQSYLGNGGFFNPEMMDHQKVGRLLLDCRDYLKALSAPPSLSSPRETGQEIEMVIEVERDHDGSYSALCRRQGGKEGIGAASSPTPIGALANLIADIIKVDEDNSIERRSEATRPRSPASKELEARTRISIAQSLLERGFDTVNEERWAAVVLALAEAQRLLASPLSPAPKDELGEPWHCPYCDYITYTGLVDWADRANAHIRVCVKVPAPLSLDPPKET